MTGFHARLLTGEIHQFLLSRRLRKLSKIPTYRRENPDFSLFFSGSLSAIKNLEFSLINSRFSIGFKRFENIWPFSASRNWNKHDLYTALNLWEKSEEIFAKTRINQRRKQRRKREYVYPTSRSVFLKKRLNDPWQIESLCLSSALFKYFIGCIPDLSSFYSRMDSGRYSDLDLR